MSQNAHVELTGDTLGKDFPGLGSMMSQNCGLGLEALHPNIKASKRTFFRHFFTIFSRIVRIYGRFRMVLRGASSRLFEFSILLRRGPGLGPGVRARAWAGA